MNDTIKSQNKRIIQLEETVDRLILFGFCHSSFDVELENKFDLLKKGLAIGHFYRSTKILFESTDVGLACIKIKRDNDND